MGGGCDSVQWEEILQPYSPPILPSWGEIHLHTRIAPLQPTCLSPLLPPLRSLLPSFLNPSLSSFLPFPLVPPHPLPSLSSSLLRLPFSRASFFPSSITPPLRQAPTCRARGGRAGAVHSPGVLNAAAAAAAAITGRFPRSTSAVSSPQTVNSQPTPPLLQHHPFGTRAKGAAVEAGGGGC